MRLFLDANVLFSAAHNPDGNARALFSLAGRGIVELYCSQFARDEASRNIALKFPHYGETLDKLITSTKLVPEPQPSVIKIAISAGLPEKDAPILAAAIAARVDLLVTGDKSHFATLFGQQVEGVTTLPPAEALALVLTDING